MPDGNEFKIVGAATLKPRDAKAVRIRGTDNRLAFAEFGSSKPSWRIKKISS